MTWSVPDKAKLQVNTHSTGRLLRTCPERPLPWQPVEGPAGGWDEADWPCKIITYTCCLAPWNTGKKAYSLFYTIKSWLVITQINKVLLISSINLQIDGTGTDKPCLHLHERDKTVFFQQPCPTQNPWQASPPAVCNQWTGPLDWTTELDYWTGWIFFPLYFYMFRLAICELWCCCLVVKVTLWWCMA